MAVEIERKFRVVGDGWRAQVGRARRIRQAYLALNERVSIRVRISDDETATLTIKTVAAGTTRDEFEYAIPVADAEALVLRRQGAVIAKTRHEVEIAGLVWEIDVFEGDNAGLVLAEIELDRADRPIDLPDWIGAEVTHDRRFYNAELAQRPFGRW